MKVRKATATKLPNLSTGVAGKVGIPYISKNRKGKKRYPSNSRKEIQSPEEAGEVKPAFSKTRFLKKTKPTTTKNTHIHTQTCLGAGSYGGALCAKSEGKGRDEKAARESFKRVRAAE